MESTIWRTFFPPKLPIHSRVAKALSSLSLIFAKPSLLLDLVYGFPENYKSIKPLFSITSFGPPLGDCNWPTPLLFCLSENMIEVPNAKPSPFKGIPHFPHYIPKKGLCYFYWEYYIQRIITMVHSPGQRILNH